VSLSFCVFNRTEANEIRKAQDLQFRGNYCNHTCNGDIIWILYSVTHVGRKDLVQPSVKPEKYAPFHAAAHRSENGGQRGHSRACVC
jgi:hypothetical protein